MHAFHASSGDLQIWFFILINICRLSTILNNIDKAHHHKRSILSFLPLKLFEIVFLISKLCSFEIVEPQVLWKINFKTYTAGRVESGRTILGTCSPPWFGKSIPNFRASWFKCFRLCFEKYFWKSEIKKYCL